MCARPAAPARPSRARRLPGRGCRSARRPGSARGACTSARAIATRCNWPPDSVCGRRVAQAGQARPRRAAARTRAVVVAAAAAAAAARRSAPRSGAAARGRPGTRSRGRARRSSACSRLAHAPSTSSPSSRTRPASSVSSPAMQFSSVDLPTPDSPRMATNSPGATLEVDAREHRRARRSVWPGRAPRSIGSGAPSGASASAARASATARSITPAVVAGQHLAALRHAAQPGELALGELPRGGDAALGQCRRVRRASSASQVCR